MKPINLEAAVLDCKDIYNLSDFYIKMLGWEIFSIEKDLWIDICAIDCKDGVRIAFQYNEEYIPPVWPEQSGSQQQMTHLDFVVNDKKHLKEAVAHAVKCGAALSEIQFNPDEWITLFDPEGHPFCFVIKTHS